MLHNPPTTLLASSGRELQVHAKTRRDNFTHRHQDVITASNIHRKSAALFTLYDTSKLTDIPATFEYDVSVRIQHMLHANLTSAVFLISDSGNKIPQSTINSCIQILINQMQAHGITLKSLALDGTHKLLEAIRNELFTSTLERLVVNDVGFSNDEFKQLTGTLSQTVNKNNFQLLYGPEPGVDQSEAKKNRYKRLMEWIVALKEAGITCLPYQTNAKEVALGSNEVLQLSTITYAPSSSTTKHINSQLQMSQFIEQNIQSQATVAPIVSAASASTITPAVTLTPTTSNDSQTAGLETTQKPSVKVSESMSDIQSSILVPSMSQILQRLGTLSPPPFNYQKEGTAEENAMADSFLMG